MLRTIEFFSLGLSLTLLLMVPGAWGSEVPRLRLRPALTSPVYAVAYSPDGKIVASGQQDGTLRLWDTASGGELRALPGNDPVLSMVFSPDGELLACLIGSAKVRHIGIWDVATAALLHTLKLTGEPERTGNVFEEYFEGLSTMMGFKPTFNVDFSPDGRSLAACGDEPTLWNVATGERVLTFDPEGTDGSCQSLAFTPDGRKLLTSGRSLLVWNVRSGKLERSLGSDTSTKGPIRFHPDGRSFASAGKGDSRDFGFRIWDPDRGEVVRFLAGLSALPDVLAYSRDGRYLAGGGRQSGAYYTPAVKPSTLQLWSTETGNRMHDFSQLTAGVNALAFSPDGTFLVTATATGLSLWETSSGRKVSDFFTAEILSTQHLSFTPDSRYLFTASRDGWAGFWDLRTGERTAVRSPVPTSAALVATADGHLIASVFKGGKVSQETRSRVSRGNGPPMEVKQTWPWIIHLWSAGEVSRSASFTAPGQPIMGLDLSPDGRFLAVASSVSGPSTRGGAWLGALKIWRTESRGEARTLYLGGSKDENERRIEKVLGRHSLQALAFAPDGRTLATVGGDGRSELLLWNVLSGDLLTLRHGDDTTISDLHSSPLSALAFSGDGRLLATGSQDGTLQLFGIERSSWGSRGPRVTQTLGGKGAEITALSFVGEGTLASGDDEGSIRVWDFAAGVERFVLKGHSDRIRALAVSPDRKSLASAADDRVVRLWDLATGEERLGLIALAGKGSIALTPDLYYMANRDSRDLISFLLDDRLYPFEQFDLRLHRPDLVVSRLPDADPDLVNTYRQARERRLERIGYTEEMLTDDFHLPTLRLLDAASLPAFTSEPRIRLRLEADDSRVALESLHVWVNGVPIYGSRGRPVEGRRGVQLDVEVVLSAGDNRIEAAVRNAQGAESLLIRRQVKSDRPAEQADLYILAVGVALYRDAEKNLSYSSKDAEDIAALFRRSRRHANVHTRLLVDSEATRDEILASRAFLEQAGVDDQVVVFVAGHGVRDEQDNHYYYFAPHDMDFVDLARHGIAHEDLEDLVDGLASRKKLMMIDTCGAGELETVIEPSAARPERSENASLRGADFIPDLDEETGRRIDSLFVELRRGTGTTVITASAGQEWARETDEIRNGSFTYSVRQGIMTRQADLDSDGRIMASELREYVTLKVLEASGGAQRPTLRRENLAHDFQVW